MDPGCVLHRDVRVAEGEDVGGTFLIKGDLWIRSDAGKRPRGFSQSSPGPSAKVR